MFKRACNLRRAAPATAPPLTLWRALASFSGIPRSYLGVADAVARACAPGPCGDSARMRSCCRGGRGDSARMRSCCRGRAWGCRAARVHRGHEKAWAELVHASSAFLHTTLTIYFRSRGRSQSCLLMGRGVAQVCPAQRWAKWQSSLAPVGQSTFNEPTFSNNNVCARHPPRAVDRKHYSARAQTRKRENVETCQKHGGAPQGAP